MTLVRIMSFLISLHVCNAGVFGYEGDALAGGAPACGESSLPGVAHRDAPCGTRMLLLNPRTMRSAVVQVVDHGPYGARVGKRFVVKRRASDPGVWRGCLDLRPRAARAVGSNGMEPIIYTILR